MGDGSIRPFILVLPHGEQGYWVDQVGGPQWSTYLVKDVVPEIDKHYRTKADQADRAIGGFSMGAHGALQIPINFPGVFSIVGANSPSFRPRAEVQSYFGNDAPVRAARPGPTLRGAPGDRPEPDDLARLRLAGRLQAGATDLQAGADRQRHPLRVPRVAGRPLRRLLGCPHGGLPPLLQLRLPDQIIPPIIQAAPAHHRAGARSRSRRSLSMTFYAGSSTAI